MFGLSWNTELRFTSILGMQASPATERRLPRRLLIAVGEQQQAVPNPTVASGIPSRMSQKSFFTLPVLVPPWKVKAAGATHVHGDIDAIERARVVAHILRRLDQQVGLTEDVRVQVVEWSDCIAAAVRKPVVDWRGDGIGGEVFGSDQQVVGDSTVGRTKVRR